MSDITNPHDAFFKQFMARPEIAADFLTQHLPADVLAILDLATLNEQKESFIDPDLRQQFSDILYQVKTKRGKPVYVYQLFEHKSYPDKWVAFQLLRYKVRIWEKELAKHNRILPIITLVVYHGQVNWTMPPNFAALFDWEERGAKIEESLQLYIPDFAYHLVDLSAMDDTEIQGGVWLQVFELLLKHIFDPTLGQRLPEILGLIAHVASQPTGFEMLVTLLRYVARSGAGASREEIRRTVLTLFPREGAILMKTAAQEWIEEALAEGIQKGEAIGIQKGEAIGIQKGEAIGIQKAQRQNILQILNYRFTLSPEIDQDLSARLAGIADEKVLATLVNDALQVIHLTDFTQRLDQRLAVTTTPSAPSPSEE
jgi:predicted transposase/invertase (TIGR01784 family)